MKNNQKLCLQPDNNRFGKNPSDPEQLVRDWNNSRPGVPTAEWSSFWGETIRKAEMRSVEAKSTGTSGFPGILKLAMAAGIASVALYSINEFTGVTPKNLNTSQSTDGIHRGGDLAHVKPVSIELDEADALAVIRVDDTQCTAQKPCMDTIDTQTDEISETALASNFQLFNDMEALAAE